MQTERILSAGMAVVVIAAVGLSASTLAASMSTDPADAVDVEWETLPLGEEGQGELEAAARDVDETYRKSTDGTGDGQRSEAGDGQQRESRGDDGAASGQQGGENAGDRESRGEAADDGDRQAGGADRDEQVGQSGATALGPVDWALWLALLLAVVTIAYRYRDRLRRALGRGADGQAAERLAPAPQNDVERAWVELVERAGVDRPRTRTPRDCARRAVERGFDPGHVEALRRTFEDVRYGTTQPTDEQARRARETLAALDGERT